MRAPWIKDSKSLFAPENETQGNLNPDRAKYQDPVWRKESARFRAGKKCENPRCIGMAQMVDHRIRVKDGGAMFDRRNWAALCNPCHNRKRGKEAHGYIEEWVETPHGRIPKDRAHLPPDIAGQSYMIQNGK